MSVMSMRLLPSLTIVEEVRRSCKRMDGDAGRCVDWIFKRLADILEKHPGWKFRQVWHAMKHDRAWSSAGFSLQDWRRASSHVAHAFDCKFQAPTRSMNRRRQGRRYVGRRTWYPARKIAA